MIVSGFAIAHLVTTNPEPYHLYIWRRWLRLFPLFALVTATGVFVIRSGRI